MPQVEVAKSTDVRENAVFATVVDKTRLILVRVEGRVRAVENRCAHMGWSMERGSLEATTLTCPWHGSKFDVCSGENLDWVDSFAGVPMPRWTHRMIAMGKKPKGIRTFEATEEDGRVFVTLPE